jgi:hypothetical protein
MTEILNNPREITLEQVEEIILNSSIHIASSICKNTIKEISKDLNGQFIVKNNNEIDTITTDINTAVERYNQLD